MPDSHPSGVRIAAMGSSEFPYDVAFSLLDQDEPLTHDVAQLLEPSSVFLYSERQLELVGNEGIEKFSAAFGRDARTVAIMHRAGWGDTKWTRIEETAIKERFYNRGPEFLTIIKLDDAALPRWMPATRIWGDFQRLNVEGVAAVLAERLRQAGASVREETAEELAARIEQERTAEARRVGFLQSEEGVQAATLAANDALSELKRIGEKIGAAVTEESNVVLLWRDGFSVTAGWQLVYFNTLNESALHIVEWEGRPDVGGRFFGKKREVVQHRFTFDRPSPGDAVWVDGRSKQMFGSKQLAEHAGKLLLRRVLGKIRE